MKKSRSFTSGAQAFIAELLQRGISVDAHSFCADHQTQLRADGIEDALVTDSGYHWASFNSVSFGNGEYSRDDGGITWDSGEFTKYTPGMEIKK